MSEQATIFEFPYDLFLKQRLEFVVICQDHLAASIMRIVEYEMLKLKESWQDKVVRAAEEKKTAPREPKTYWVRLSQGQIIARLYMYDSAKLKKPESEDLESEEWAEYRARKALSISKSTLKKAIDLLIDMGFLLMRSKPGDEFGAPLYTLHKENVQKALKALPENPFAIFHQLGGVSNFESGGESQILNVPPSNFESGESQNCEVPPSENESPQSQNLRVNKDIDRDSLEIEKDNEEEGYVAPAIAAQSPAPDSLSQQTQSEPPKEMSPAQQEHREAREQVEALLDDTEGRLKAIKVAKDNSAVYTNSFNEDGSVYSAGAPTNPPAQNSPAPKDFRTGVLPRRPKVQAVVTSQPLFPSTKQSTRPQLTPVGKQVLEWYEAIRAMKVRRTNENINACNGLSEEDGISFENLKRAIEHWEADKFVKKRQIPIDLQQLENPKGSFTYAKAMLVISREPDRSKPKEDDNNIQDWTEASQRKIAAEEASGERQRKYQAALKLLEETRLRDQANANS